MSRVHNLDQLYAKLRASIGSDLEALQKAAQDLSAQDLELIKAISSVQDTFVVLATMGERKGLWTRDDLLAVTQEVMAAAQKEDQADGGLDSVVPDTSVTIFGG